MEALVLVGLVVIMGGVVFMNVLFYSALARARYWFNAFMDATRELPPSTAIAMLESHPVPKSLWRRAA